jgi:preprotein translocase subunit SecG
VSTSPNWVRNTKIIAAITLVAPFLVGVVRPNIHWQKFSIVIFCFWAFALTILAFVAPQNLAYFGRNAEKQREIFETTPRLMVVMTRIFSIVFLIVSLYFAYDTFAH